MFKLKQAHSSYFLNNYNNDPVFHQQDTSDFGRHFSELGSLQNHSVESQFQSPLLSQGNKYGMSTAFRPIIGTKVEQSMNLNSSFFQPKTSQTK